jgi:hypothetical protein
MPSLAIIASFRNHYEPVLAAREVFLRHGIEVTSPKGSPIIKPGIPFVRFQSDPHHAPDCVVQSTAVHRILRADAVYVVAPDGYVGRTTCYEIGRAVQAGRPLYFSEPPKDLPICVPTDHVVSPETLALMLIQPGVPVERLHDQGADACCQLERKALNGTFISD